MIKLQNVKFLKSEKEINLEFPNHGFIALKGVNPIYPNYILDAIATYTYSYLGDIFFQDKNLKELSDEEKGYYRSNVVGYVSFKENKEKTIEDVFHDLYLEEDTIKEALKKVGLEKELNQSFKELTRSEKKLAFLARAIVNHPKVILLPLFINTYEDKTLFDKEIEEAYAMLDVLKEFSKDSLVLIATNLQKSISSYLDRIIYIRERSILLDDNLKDEIIEEKEEEFTYEVKKLSFKKSLFMSLRLLKGFIPFIIFMAFALVFIGLSTSYIFYDPYMSIYLAHQNEESSADLLTKTYSFNQYSYYVTEEGEKISTHHSIVRNEYYPYDYSTKHTGISPITQEEIDSINEKDKNTIYCGVQNLESTFPFEVSAIYYSNKLSKIAEANENFMNYHKLPLACGAYPKDYTEIAISTYMADSILESHYTEALSYEDIIGQSHKISFGTREKEMKISGIYDFGKLDSKFDVLKSEEEALKMELMDLIYLISDHIDYCKFQSLLTTGFVKEGFLKENKFYFNSEESNFHLKCFGEPSFVNCSYFDCDLRYRYVDDSYIPFEEVYNQEGYTFFDFDGNIIENPTLDLNECYIPFQYFFDLRTDLPRNATEINYSVNLTLKGFYYNPDINIGNLITATKTLEENGYTNFIDVYQYTKSEYETPKERYFDSLLVLTDYSYSHIKNLHTNYNGKGYEYMLYNSRWAFQELSFTTPNCITFFSIGMGVLLLSLLIFVLRINNSNQNKSILSYRRNGLTKKNTLKIFLMSSTISLLISLVLGIIGSVLGVFFIKLQVKNGDYTTSNIIQLVFNGYGYLILIGIILIFFLISLFIVHFKLKKKNFDALRYE